MSRPFDLIFFATLCTLLFSLSLVHGSRRSERMAIGKLPRGGGNISCSIHTCVNKGDSCSPCNDADTACDDGCPYPLRCVTVSEGTICLKKVEGEECNNLGNECQSGFGEPDLVCSSGGAGNTCIIETPDDLVPGDFCESDGECRGSLLCTDGVCAGAAVGEACSDQEDCNPGLFCDEEGIITSNTCQEYTGEGGPCEEDEDCGGWFTCEDGSYFGEPCANDNFDCCFLRNQRNEDEACGGDDMCREGLTCVNDRCIAPITDNVGNTCQNNQDCVNDGVRCRCDFAVGTGICVEDVETCVKERRNVEECLVSKGCSLESSFDDANSCARARCENEWLKRLDCQNKQSDSLLDGTCEADGRLASGASTLQWSFAALY